ncbi:MAG: thiamine diphosphokinase [Smithellaceae bacterium]
MHQKIVIVSGGRLGCVDFFRKEAAKPDGSLLIACDGGARHLVAAGIVPHVLMGDLDSIDSALLADYLRLNVKIVEHPRDKDFTDTALALDYAMALKPERIDIWGAQGGRFDHALANVLLLVRGQEAGIRTRLMDEYGEIFLARDNTRFLDAVGCVVSIIALSPTVEGVTLAGFQYPLNNDTLTMSESRGISNVIIEPVASIDVREGHLLVVRYWQKDIFPEVS